MEFTYSSPDEFIQGNSINYKNWQSNIIILISYDHGKTFYELIK